MADYVWSADARLLGSGTDGEVREGLDRKTGTKVAMKKMADRRDLYERVKNESHILQSVQGHSNIIKLLGMTKKSAGTFMVFELLDMDLWQWMRSRPDEITPKEIKLVMRQLLDALSALHARGIVHQDVKPPNVFVRSEPLAIKLADFSHARTINTMPGLNNAGTVGTIEYSAPELLAAMRNFAMGIAGDFGAEIDMWSAGCVFAELLLGRSPFDAGGDEDDALLRLESTLERIRLWRPEDERQEIEDPKALELLRRLLTVDPSRRITAREALELAYFRDDCDGEEQQELLSSRRSILLPTWLQNILPTAWLP